MRLFLLFVVVALLQAAANARADSTIVVNGSPLPHATVIELTTRYSVQVAPGRYWYDPATGLWGMEGGPSAGRLVPGLEMGGPLRADASRGDTGIFVNGREIHRSEHQQLVALFGYVAPGRYWLDASGIGGREGEPASFDLGALAAKAQGGRRESLLSGYFLTGVAVFGY